MTKLTKKYTQPGYLFHFALADLWQNDQGAYPASSTRGSEHSCDRDHATGEAESNCSCGCSRDKGGVAAEDTILEIQDEESGEKLAFVMAGQFEYKDDLYDVLLEDKTDVEEYFIVRDVQDADGDLYIETLTDDEAEEVWNYLDELIENSLGEDEFFPEGDVEE